MELDRNSIVRGDFPLERRGYARAAVDAHLDAVAVAVAELVAARIDANTASTVSNKVESIVTAAEEAASRIEREAHERAREQEARVEAATNTLLERIDALRAGVEQLAGGLNEAPPPAAPAAKSDNGAPDPPAVVVPVELEPEPAEVEIGEPGPVLELVPEPPEEPEASAPARSTVVEDARLVALQMLLEGSSRDEVDGYLAKHFELPDRAALLDAVVAAVGG